MKNKFLLLIVAIIFCLFLSSCNVTVLTTDPHVHEYVEHTGLIHERMSEGLTTYYTCKDCNAYFDKEYNRINAFNENASLKDWNEEYPFFSQDMELKYHEGMMDEVDNLYNLLINQIKNEEVSTSKVNEEIIKLIEYKDNINYSGRLYYICAFLYLDEVGYNVEYYKMYQDLSNYEATCKEYICRVMLELKEGKYNELYDDSLVYNIEKYARDVELSLLIEELGFTYEDYDNFIDNLNLLRTYCTERANLYGYDNYYDFAFKYFYGRDFKYDDYSVMFENTKTKLLELNDVFDTRVNKIIDEILLDVDEYIKYMTIFDPFYTFEDLDGYYDAVGGLLKDKYNDYINNGLYFIGNQRTPYQTAYTDAIGDITFTWYQAYLNYLTTFVHEFGHYTYCSTYSYEEATKSSFDYNEATSQANELVVSAYLCNKYPDSVAWKLLYWNRMAGFLRIAIRDCAVTQMEYYAFNEPDITMEKLSNEWDRLCTEYNVEKGSDEFAYWSYNLFVKTCYNPAYASSGLSILSLGALALEDFDSAATLLNNIYLVDPTIAKNASNAFKQAGLGDPFDVDFYDEIYDILMNILN